MSDTRQRVEAVLREMSWCNNHSDDRECFYCTERLDALLPLSRLIAAALRWREDADSESEEILCVEIDTIFPEPDADEPRPGEAGTCDTCGGPVYHRAGKPGEFDHECEPRPEDALDSITCDGCGKEYDNGAWTFTGADHWAGEASFCRDCTKPPQPEECPVGNCVLVHGDYRLRTCDGHPMQQCTEECVRRWPKCDHQCHRPQPEDNQ